MRILIPILLVAVSACSKSPELATDHDQRQAELDRIADGCHLARSTFKLVGKDELHFQPSPDADFKSVDCALNEIKKASLPYKMGFVGNEYYDRNEQ